MAKLQPSWNELLTQLSSGTDIDGSVKAAKLLAKAATRSNIKELYSLLKSKSFFIREAAAVPLARLEGIKALPTLFEAMLQGEDDGHDNDGLVNTIIGVIESNKKKVTPLLLDMLKSKSSRIRGDAVWALGFLTSQLEATLFIDLVRNDEDPEIRSIAAEALQSYPGSKKKYPINTEAFQGQWMWLDTSADLQYGFEIKGAQGICIKSNSPALVIGEIILKIHLADNPVFVGEQLFTNWAWYQISAIKFDNNKLQFRGAGPLWTMEKI